jgi:hypothetical protein
MNERYNWTRRQLLARSAHGFGKIALAGLLADDAFASLAQKTTTTPFHHAPRAKRVIFLYMDGGPSQVDTFDPKPRLDREHGQPIGMKIPATQFDNVGNVLKSPWAFRPGGECGTPVSDLFPHVREHVDDLLVVRSMVSDFPEHTAANYFLHTGHGQQGRPSMGCWVTYGLGSEQRDLPGFLVLNGGLIPPGGLDNFHNGFLPARYQGSIFKHGAMPVANVVPREQDPALQRAKLDLLRRLDGRLVERTPAADALESAIDNYELAYRMQSAVPELMDLRAESAATRALYGVDDKPTQIFGRLCLIARRLCEEGVRFIELTVPDLGHDRWDQHTNHEAGHRDNALAVDKPIAGLLTDLKARGLLDDTLVVWAGEFGRTPMAQGVDGRDHNPHGFSIWLAGGGVKGGTVYGATDEYGYYAIENKVRVHDLQATMLHLLGFDHTRLTFRFSSRDMRLTDVHGEVRHDWFA